MTTMEQAELLQQAWDIRDAEASRRAMRRLAAAQQAREDAARVLARNARLTRMECQRARTVALRNARAARAALRIDTSAAA